MSVSVAQGSIPDAKADALVNPANSFLRHSGGLAAIIDRAATQGFASSQDAIEGFRGRRDSRQRR